MGAWTGIGFERGSGAGSWAVRGDIFIEDSGACARGSSAGCSLLACPDTEVVHSKLPTSRMHGLFCVAANLGARGSLPSPAWAGRLQYSTNSIKNIYPMPIQHKVSVQWDCFVNLFLELCALREEMLSSRDPCSPFSRISTTGNLSLTLRETIPLAKQCVSRSERDTF